MEEERYYVGGIFEKLLPLLEPAVGVLPVRVACFLKAWAHDMPSKFLPQVLDLLNEFLTQGSTMTVRVAPLSPLSDLLSKFSDHPVWGQAQLKLVEALLHILKVGSAMRRASRDSARFHGGTAVPFTCM